MEEGMRMLAEEPKLDLRIEKTYRALCEAFTELLAERRYEDITVSDLCDRAMIRRTTFYKHFADKREFLSFYVRRIREEFQRRGNLRERDEDIRAHHAYMIHELVVFLQENEQMVRGCLTSNAIETIAEVLMREIVVSVERELAASVERGVSFCAPPHVLAEFITGGLIATLRDWLRDDMGSVGAADMERHLNAMMGPLLGGDPA